MHYTNNESAIWTSEGAIGARSEAAWYAAPSPIPLFAEFTRRLLTPRVGGTHRRHKGARTLRLVIDVHARFRSCILVKLSGRASPGRWPVRRVSGRSPAGPPRLVARTSGGLAAGEWHYMRFLTLPSSVLASPRMRGMLRRWQTRRLRAATMGWTGARIAHPTPNCAPPARHRNNRALLGACMRHAA